MGIQRSLETWRNPTPNDTRTFHVTAGVTRITAVQVTNNTSGEVWLSQGTSAPTAVETCDFVIPPRATANYPLDHEAVSVRWSAQVQEPNDLITFAFTDQDVTPVVYPGVEPVKTPPPYIPPNPATGIMGKPIWNVNDPHPYIWPMYTDTGRNIGSVYVYNPTHFTVKIESSDLTPAGFTAIDITIMPYTWKCIPLNVASGRLYCLIEPSVPVLTASWYNLIDVMWCDIDFVDAFPAGGGPAGGYDQYALYGMPSVQQSTSWVHDTSFGRINYVAIPARTRFLIRNADLNLMVVQGGSLGQAIATLVADKGFNGLTGPANLLVVRAIAGTGQSPSTVNASVQEPILIENYSSSTAYIYLSVSATVPSGHPVTSGHLSGILIQ